MAAKVIWSPLSLNDVFEITAFIAADNVPAALKMGERLIDATERLSAFPYLGRPLREKNRPDLRELVVADYRIICRIEPDGTVVTIVRVWHGARGEFEPPPS